MEETTNSVDQIVAASAAASAAQAANMLVESNVSNLSISLEVKNELAQSDNSLLNKPQIVQHNSGKKGLSRYTTKAGDTVKGLAVANGVSEDTIKWANNLTSDALAPGREVIIPSTTGIVYTVKAGDDATKLATKYQADKDRIITYNDLELSGLAPGQQIIIPSGILPSNERPGFAPPVSRLATSRSYGASYGGRLGFAAGNPYDDGYCTAYAYDRRVELGLPVGTNWGNATSWAYFARAAGLRVDRAPSAGAILQSSGTWGGYGHVAVVERVNADGSIEVSEMNYAGWGVRSNRTVPAGQVGAYNYIH